MAPAATTPEMPVCMAPAAEVVEAAAEVLALDETTVALEALTVDEVAVVTAWLVVVVTAAEVCNVSI